MGIQHLSKHKMIYERHRAGESYVSLAKELGISPPRIREKALRWERELKRQSSSYNQIKTEAEIRVELESKRANLKEQQQKLSSFNPADSVSPEDLKEYFLRSRLEAIVDALEWVLDEPRTTP